MTETSAVSVAICGQCYAALNVAERAVILTVLLYRNGMVVADGSFGPIKPAMFTVVAMGDNVTNLDGETVAKNGLYPTVTSKMRKLGLLSDNKLHVSDELLALRHLNPDMAEIDIKALGLPAVLMTDLYHEKDKQHPNGPIFDGRSVVPLGCEHASTAPVMTVPTEDKDVLVTATPAVDMQADPEGVMGMSPGALDGDAPASSTETETALVVDDAPEELEPAIAEVSVESVPEEMDDDVRLTNELLESIKKGAVDPDMVEKLVVCAEGLQERVNKLEGDLEVERAKNERHGRTIAVLRGQISLLRDRLAGTQLSQDVRERVVRVLNRGSSATPTTS